MQEPVRTVVAHRPQLSSPSAPAGRLARSGRALLVAGAAGLALTLVPGTATAAPAPAAPAQAGSPEEATQLVADATHQLEVVTEQVNDAQVQLAEQQASAAAAAGQLADAEAQLQVLGARMDEVAVSAYTGNQSGISALLTSTSPEDFLAQVSTLDLIAGHTDDLLTQVSAAAQVATDAQAAADAAAAQAQQTLDQVSAQQADLQQQIVTYQAQYAALSAPQQAAVVAATSGPEVVAPAAVVADGAAAQTVVDTAMAQRGDPYVWAAGGPDSFDCSGLTAYAYAAAGVSLPHSSAAQARMGTAVARADLQPGDLVYFYSPVSHIGIYIGNGMMVHAPTSGDVVKVSSIDMSGYAGARRLL
ncbi:Cell wall-associated hydrolase, NlpC family [Klenkia marina]|uniref:Cell wall-associated hydrolase, NlpC family n=1 Tax=Klenkia marina TaxID=1960309 RepID=A0A1G4Y8R9_9ACTN|nr:C40 family peptidase [Klenkia marina]SCX49856.1 Cell wall-associated hydrolase, NlpC family [Klenkia marina]